jgi:hypothetical protein
MAVFLTDAYREEDNKQRVSKKQETISNLVSGGIGKIISRVAWINIACSCERFIWQPHLNKAPFCLSIEDKVYTGSPQFQSRIYLMAFSVCIYCFRFTQSFVTISFAFVFSLLLDDASPSTVITISDSLVSVRVKVT